MRKMNLAGLAFLFEQDFVPKCHYIYNFAQMDMKCAGKINKSQCAETPCWQLCFREKVMFANF